MCQQFTSKVQGSIQQINKVINNLWITIKKRLFNAQDTPMLYTCLTRRVHSRQEPFKGLNQRLKGVALGVAGVLVGALCLVSTMTLGSQEVPIQKTVSTISLDSYAKMLLTHKTYKCFRALAFRESSWDGTDNSPSFKARNGSHYGFMQGRSIHLKGASADRQFWWSFRYVAHRYGITRYDEPNYCGALAHSKKRGWH